MSYITTDRFLKCGHSATTWGIRKAHGNLPPTIKSTNEYCRGCTNVRKRMRKGLFTLGKVITAYMTDFDYDYVMLGTIPAEVEASAKAIMNVMRQELQLPDRKEECARIVKEYWGESTVQWLGVDARLCLFHAVRLLTPPGK